MDKPGEYRLAIKYGDKHIPNSPFRIWVMPEQDLAKKIVLESLQTKTATQNKTLTMKVHLNGVSLKRKTTSVKEETTTTEQVTTTTTKTTKSSQDNELIAKLVSPSGKEEDIFLTEIDENECILSFKCREQGPHVVNVRLNNVHVTNSPMNFFVRKREEKKTTKKEETTTTTKTTTSKNETDTSKTNVQQTNVSTKDTSKTTTDTSKTTTDTSKTTTDTSKITSDTSKTTVTEKTEETTTITCTKTQVKIVGINKEIKSSVENTFIVNTQSAPAG